MGLLLNPAYQQVYTLAARYMVKVWRYGHDFKAPIGHNL